MKTRSDGQKRLDCIEVFDHPFYGSGKLPFHDETDKFTIKGVIMEDPMKGCFG
jgi:hypothetical protein